MTSSDASDVSSFSDDSVKDPPYLADTTTTETEGEDEPVAGPSGINTPVVERGVVHDDSATSESDFLKMAHGYTVARKASYYNRKTLVTPQTLRETAVDLKANIRSE